MSDILYYVICTILTIGVLIGIAMMSKVQSSVRGNTLSALCTAAAIILTMCRYNILSRVELWVCIAAGLAVGIYGAYKVKMIDMPQTVAILNGFGGAASALVAVISMLDGYSMNAFGLTTASLALAVGAITLTGSLIAAGKLHKILPQKPVVWPNHRAISSIALMLTLVSVIAVVFVGIDAGNLVPTILACTLVSAFFGVAFSIRVGGADMPITISLLNSLSGVAGSIAGMAIGDPLLVAVGGVVGASGLLLTQIMCRAMNRSLADILTGKTSVVAKSGSPTSVPTVEAPAPTVESQEETLSEKFARAKNVIIVPGYGMAIAQAQSLVKQLADKLVSNGAEVSYAIHPVAGRMPGHMNVLLCEVDIPYEDLREMDEVNPKFADCDIAIVVGANDVINPAANTAEGTPIYGMPVLEVEKAKDIIICNFDLSPGYAGVPNPLYTKENGVTLLLGDAKESLNTLICAV